MAIRTTGGPAASPTALGLSAALFLWSAERAGAVDLENILSYSLEGQASGVMSMLGLAAVPDSTSSGLQFRSDLSEDSRSRFDSWQTSGGFTLSKSVPIYLEGSIGYNRYNPDLLVTDGVENARLRPKWTGIAATGGIGWDFALSDAWTFRPILNFTLGQVFTDTQYVARFISNALGNDETAFIRDGGLTVGGYGGSLALVYNRQWDSGVEADAMLRYTDIYLQPIGGDKEVVGDASARTLALWSRMRTPNSWRAFGSPMRTVYEFSASYLGGDQGQILNTDWLAQLGLGLEVNTTKTHIPWVDEGRIVFRYTVGENLVGWGIGLAVSF
ncbi:autotransporter outer membrane beta-barrel domain-containing protein [Falsirhodobacter sp. alg1]|uniref:autotransporter outer membrane beta-barrel domain-containing protein n=1 Tax=Falsirhodobacter sp. alg1 TaxID=1472418 RepID=UPI0006946177|nr:autotransporter outer membrane beta-barrel domain-containing protein [Falsirhodobacter sp. alg1]